MRLLIKGVLLLLLSLTLLALFMTYKYSTFTKIGFINQFTLRYPTDLPKEHIAFPTLAKAAEERLQNRVKYDARYFEIDYPMGDIPDNLGVCTDVVIRSYRALGIDLQELVHEDMSDNFFLYPKMWRLWGPDTNIDHRRVPNLMVFFKRYGTILTIARDAESYKPGDIVCWNIGRGTMHIGLVSATKSAYTGNYMIVHNIGSGPKLEDVLLEWEIIGHFQYRPDVEE